MVITGYEVVSWVGIWNETHIDPAVVYSQLHCWIQHHPPSLRHALLVCGLSVNRNESAPNPAPTAASPSPPIQLGRIKISEGEIMSNLQNALQELREKRRRDQIEIDKLDQIIALGSNP
jgi:hypothetical protein